MTTKITRRDVGRAFEHTSAPIAFADVSASGSVVVLSANRAALTLTGASSGDALATMLQTALAEHGVADVRERIDLRFPIAGAAHPRRDIIAEVAVLSDDSDPDGQTDPGAGTRVIVYLRSAGDCLGEDRVESLSALPESNPNIVMVLRCPGHIDYVNGTGRLWLERRGASTSDELFALLPPDLDRVVCDACDRRTLQTWTIGHEQRSYEVRITPLGTADRCMVTINDITELVELTRRHEVFYKAFRAAHTPIMITDSDGRIEYVNDYFERLYGFTIDNIRGRTPNIVNPGREAYHELGFSDEDYDALFRGLWDAIGDPAIGFWQADIPNRTADGRLIWVRMLIHSVRDDGKISSYIGFPIDITESRDKELRLRLEAYEAISDLAELRDNETGSHIKRVGRYAMELARRLGHSRMFQEELLSFAPLHDIGKVGIPDEILRAPRSLTDHEMRVMRRHTVLGYELFSARPSLETAASIAHGHHERWDGTGYPRGLAGADIPLCARIVSLCDVYDALRSERPYKRAWSHDETVAHIAAGRATQFDPEVVDAFLGDTDAIGRIYDELPDEL